MTTKPKVVEATAAGQPAAPVMFHAAADTIKQMTVTAVAGADKTQAQMKQGVDRAMKTAEQFAQFQQGNIEAVMKSGQALASGMQDLTKHVAATTQANFDEAMTVFRQMTTAKSLREAFDLQSTYARTAMEKALAESGKLTETGMKVAEQVAAPLTARVNAAVEAFSAR